MKRRKAEFRAVIVLTLIAAALVWALDRTEPLKNARFSEFPLVIGDWQGRDIPMSEYVYRGTETTYLLLRDYASPRYDHAVNLSIVWFEDTNIAFHAPEGCLGGVSNEVKGRGVVRVRLAEEHDLKKFIADINGTDYLVLYYFDADGHVTTSQSAIRMRVLLKRLLLSRASASLIRVMAPVGESEEKTMASLVDFLGDLYPLVPAYMYTESAARTR